MHRRRTSLFKPVAWRILALADVAIASTGTVTMECARFGVPTVAIYKTSWFTYQIARRIVQVKYAAMPNLLAGGEISPEFIQTTATPENIAGTTLKLLHDEPRARPFGHGSGKSSLPWVGQAQASGRQRQS